jgi:cytochrome c peroxidase
VTAAQRRRRLNRLREAQRENPIEAIWRGAVEVWAAPNVEREPFASNQRFCRRFSTRSVATQVLLAPPAMTARGPLRIVDPARSLSRERSTRVMRQACSAFGKLTRSPLSRLDMDLSPVTGAPAPLTRPLPRRRVQRTQARTPGSRNLPCVRRKQFRGEQHRARHRMIGRTWQRSWVSMTAAAVALLVPIASVADADVSQLGLPPLPTNARSATPAQIALGQKMFLDTKLSANGQVSCATCHQPDKAFTDGRTVAIGIEGRPGTRNTPTLANAVFYTSFSWDGRRDSLEAQTAAPFTNAQEHGLHDQAELLARVNGDPGYREAFGKAFGIDGDMIGLTHVTRALASFVSSLAAGNSAFDRYYYAGEAKALDESAKRGLELFRGRAKCVTCHAMDQRAASFTDNQFHSLGVGLPQIAPQLAALSIHVANTPHDQLDALILRDPAVAALGRFVVSGDPADIGKFKTPTLRNVAITAPYMHDGSVATLEEAVEREIYYRSIQVNQPLLLTPQEKADLISFLRALTSARYLTTPAPK